MFDVSSQIPFLVDSHITMSFAAKREVSKIGRREVLAYRIPDSGASYMFSLARRNRCSDVYQCLQCKAMNSWRTIKARGDYFLSDPSAIGHQRETRPGELHTRKYKQSDQIYVGRTPRQVYEMLEKANEEYDGKLKNYFVANTAVEQFYVADEVMKALYGWGFGMKRRAISRAINSWKDREVTLQNIPENLARLSDGRLFVQKQDAELHIYYSGETIEINCTYSNKSVLGCQKTIACKSGLYAIVADGVHTKQHKELAQLYCVHGICDGGIEIPLLYSMTARKTEDTYLKIFGHLKNLFKIHRPRSIQPLGLYSIMKKLSIAAVRRLFPYSEIEGCAFHLAQAWNRRKDTCKLRKFVQGRCRTAVFSNWWDTIKGVIFLPKRLYPQVRCDTSALQEMQASFVGTSIMEAACPTKPCGLREVQRIFGVFSRKLVEWPLQGPLEQMEKGRSINNKRNRMFFTQKG
ncbi:hypothetical protein COOONC_22092 [Cooperia oncophora]